MSKARNVPFSLLKGLQNTENLNQEHMDIVCDNLSLPKLETPYVNRNYPMVSQILSSFQGGELHEIERFLGSC